MTAPAHLSPATRAWFEAIADDYELESTDLRLLELAGVAWDRAVAAREALKAADGGVLTRDRYGALKAHPAVAIERDAIVAFARLVRELGLRGDQTPNGDL